MAAYLAASSQWLLPNLCCIAAAVRDSGATGAAAAAAAAAAAERDHCSCACLGPGRRCMVQRTMEETIKNFGVIQIIGVHHEFISNLEEVSQKNFS